MQASCGASTYSDHQVVVRSSAAKPFALFKLFKGKYASPTTLMCRWLAEHSTMSNLARADHRFRTMSNGIGHVVELNARRC
jgi:hypothetical protein